MYFITTKRMLEVCFFQHTPTFIIEPKRKTAYWKIRKSTTGQYAGGIFIPIFKEKRQ